MLKLVVIVSLLGASLPLPANLNNTNVQPRIVGGEITTIAENPWQLALLYHLQHYCGAVEISPRWALTAARCMHEVLIENLAVRAGSTTKSSGGQVIKISEIHIHPNYNGKLVDYDFTLLRLEQPIAIQDAAPASLPEPNAVIPVGKMATLSGWGHLEAQGEAPELLHKVEVPIISQELCRTLYGAEFVTDRMFCTGDTENGGVDACQGDGGGPVIVDGRLYGIISWGTGCAQAIRPGVNAKVTEVLEWIYSTSGI